MAQPQAINLVQAALRSDRDFETYKPQIINKIKASDDVFIKATVDTVKKYLKDKKKEGFSKLTALMLLKECMDTKNAAMVEYVHKKILRRLGLIAQGKDKCLPKDTSDALVKLFSQLLRECIVVWNDWFGYDKKKNPTKYKKTYDSVFAKVEKPTKLVHFTKPEAAEERVLPQSINQSEVKSGSRTPYQDLSVARPGVSDSVVVETQQQEPPKRKFEIKPQQDPFIEKMNALMKHIKGNKEMMYEQMAISEEPDQQGVKMILQNLIKANQQLADNWDELEAKEFDTKEAMIDQAIIDNETIEELVNEYNRMMKKEITMEDYRLFVIKTLSDPTKSGGFEAPAAVQASRKASEVEPSSVKVTKGQVSSPVEQRSVATPAQVQAQSQSQSQSQQRPQQNDGFDLDAFEEASPGIQASKQQAAVDQERERAARLAQEKAERDEFINGPPMRDQGQPRPPATKAVAAGSEASEGGTRKAPRNFRDLFNNDNQARGRKAGVGSKRDKSNLDDSKGSVGFGKSWDINPQGGVQTRTRNQQQQNNKAQGGGLGVDDFEDLPEPSGTYVDTSNMSSDSRTYDFNYDQSRAHGMNKSKSRLDPRDTRDNYNSQQRFSPSGNVLPPNDEYNIRGTRKVSPNPSPGYERASARQQHDWEPEEKYATNQNQNVNSNYNNNPAPAPAKKNLAVDTQAANRKYEQEQQINVQFNNRPSDGGNHGFGNPFGQADDENNNGNQSAGFPPQNTYQESKPSIKVNGVQQQQEAARRNNPQAQSQAQSQAQVQPQRSTNQQQPAAGLNNISVTQSVIAPTATGQNPRFAPIERPGFLNSLGTTQTINISTYDGPAMRQADELLDRARRLTSNSRPPSHLDTRPNLRTSVAGLDYQPIPPLFSTTAPIDLGGVRPSMATAPLDQMRRSSLERVGPYISATFNSTLPGPMVNSAVLNQSMSSAAVGDGFLREIDRAREQSKAIAAKYSSPGSRRQSDALLSANLLPAAALLQGPTKYTNGESAVNSAVKIESHDLRQSYLQQQQQSKPAKVEEIERTSYRDYNNGGKTAATGYTSERSEKLSRGYNTAKFPEAGEGKEMSRAAQLIEKARRLRDESKQRKTFAGEDSDKKEYLYKTPKSEFRNSEINNLKESAYLVDRERDTRVNDRYRDASVDRNLKTSQVETRYRAEDHLSHAAPQTFYNRYETRPQTQPQEFDNIAAVNIRSRDIPRGREPVRLMGPDGTVYEEVRQGYGIGRKPTPTPGPRDRERDSPLTVGDVRGRSKETRHETLGQLRHQEYASNMRESRAVDMKRSAYHEAKELLEASRRDISYERRGRFENNFSMATPDRNVQRNSPLKARQEQVQEAVELKVGESLRIVERPVPGNYGRSISRSPAPAGRGSVNSLKASLNVIPDTKIQQAKPSSSSQSQKLANDIKSQLNDLKRSLMGRKEKSESATSKATLQLDGSSNSVPQIGLVQQQYQHRPIVVQHEEVKVRNEEPRKLGVRVDSREIMGAYGSRIADRELKRSGVVENRTAAIVSPVRNEVVGVRLERKESETTPAITPYGTDEGFSRRLNVKEISGVQGVKLTMDDSNVWEEESTLRTRGGMEEDSLRRERETLYRELVGPSYNKPKMGRAVHFDYYLFDQITNAVFANGQGKDVDVFKGACLQKKAVLFDSAKLKIDVITRMEDEDGRSGNKLKVILHYANKSNQSITAFNVDIVENSIEQNPRINGNNLPPKYQLKQELYLDFSNFKNLCYTLQISYQHEGFPYSAKVPLPLSVNKYMKMKTVSTGEYKKQWKNLKPGSVKSKYKHINAKFIRDHTEVNKYFDNCLVDVTPTLNPKRKRKYGGVFVLPDGSEHYLRVVLDHSRIKFVVCSARGSQYADWAVQYLSYLLTV